jgi:hypothetical protein
MRRAQWRLGAWCLKLEELVYSVDRAWDWGASGERALHELVSAHTNSRIIGVRDVILRLGQVYAWVSNWEASLSAPIGDAGGMKQGATPSDTVRKRGKGGEDELRRCTRCTSS